MPLSTFPVTAASNSNPALLTISSPQAPPTGMSVGFAGGTGAWTALTGVFTAYNVNNSTTQFSVPLDSTAFGALTGTVMAFFYTATPNQGAVLQLAQPFVDQVIAIIQRDQLSYINAVDPSLNQIQEFHKWTKIVTATPWMIVGYNQTQFDPDQFPVTKQGAQIDINLIACAFDGEYAQDTALKYLRVIDGILRNAGPPYSYADWATPLPIVHETVPSGLTSPLPIGAVKNVLITRETLEPVNVKGYADPCLSVQIELLIGFTENLAAGSNA